MSVFPGDGASGRHGRKLSQCRRGVGRSFEMRDERVIDKSCLFVLSFQPVRVAMQVSVASVRTSRMSANRLTILGTV